MTYEQQLKYDAVHKWLAYYYGRVGECENCYTLDAKKFEWSLLKGKEYEKKRENFWKLCTSCHAVYDGKMVKLAENNLKPVKATIVDDFIHVGFESIKEASKILKVSKTAISNCLKGRSKTAGGYKWNYVDLWNIV